MNIAEALKKIKEIGIVPVVRAASIDEAQQAIDAICAGGIPVIEVTMTVPNATTVIREVVKKYGDTVLTGAGTVLTGEQAKECLDAGAEFLVSPGLSVPVLHVAHARGKLAIPGALTPTELMEAALESARVIKIFPCESMGGAKYLKSLKAPFPRVELIPTGGVNLSNAADYLAAGAFALGVGADLVNVAALRAGKSEEIVATAKKLVEIVRTVRAAKSAGA
jgi:2-dehydro-3-deoxyphosphogluconate aldolase / (4S)-4-hydroxy-2-oxoglutarate aldolase